MTELRTVQLGGIARRRGLLGGNRTFAETAGLGVLLMVGALWAVTNPSLWRLLGTVLLWLFGWMVFTPTRYTGDRTVAALGVERWRWWRRRRRGLTAFTPGQPAVKARRRGGSPKATTGQREVPDFVGRVRPVSVGVSTGGSVAVLLHDGGGGGPGYATLALEVEHAGGGLQGERATSAEYAQWGRFKAALAREGSLVRGLQQLERVQPASLAAHEAWLNEHVPQGVHPALVSSYDNFLTRLGHQAEWHRCLLILRMPFTVAWHTRCREEFGQQTPATRARLAVAEAQRVAQLATSDGGFRRCTPLSEAQLAKAIRSCLDADYSWTDSRPATLRTCWPTWQAHDKRVVVEGRWHLRTATIPAGGISPDPMPVTVMRALSTGIYPAVVRTITITEELTVAARARETAMQDVTLDQASVRTKSGTVTDGSESDQLSASRTRLSDLRGGTGHQGVGFAVHVTVGGRSQAEMLRACDRVASTCAEMEMPLRWMDRAQDLALAATLPLGRGLRTSRRKVLT